MAKGQEIETTVKPTAEMNYVSKLTDVEKKQLKKLTSEAIQSNNMYGGFGVGTHLGNHQHEQNLAKQIIETRNPA